jgi:hypothetical protein
MVDNPSLTDEPFGTPSQRTLAALLTATLASCLAEAVSELVGKAYDANILRLEPRADGGAQVLVDFIPCPPESTLQIAVGAEVLEIPLPPGITADAVVRERQHTLVHSLGGRRQ